MVGKSLITLFFSGQVMDIVSTYFAIIFFHHAEANPLAKGLFDTIGMEKTMGIKLLFALFFIGIYAVSIVKFTRLIWSLEKSLQIGSLFTWLVVFFNIIGVLL